MICCRSRCVLYLFEVISGRNVGFRDGLYQGIKSKWPIRTPSRTDFNDVLPTNSVIRQTFNKSRVDEVTHLEVTGVNLALDNASTKFSHVVRMSRELALFQAQHS